MAQYDPAPPRISRRTLLTGAAAAATAFATGPLLAGCTTKEGNGGGGTSQEELNRILPKYIQNTAVTADVPGVVGANGAVSDPVFLSYPANPVATVNGIPGKGSTFTT